MPEFYRAPAKHVFWSAQIKSFVGLIGGDFVILSPDSILPSIVAGKIKIVEGITVEETGGGIDLSDLEECDQYDAPLLWSKEEYDQAKSILDAKKSELPDKPW